MSAAEVTKDRRVTQVHAAEVTKDRRVTQVHAVEVTGGWQASVIYDDASEATSVGVDLFAAIREATMKRPKPIVRKR